MRPPAHISRPNLEPRLSINPLNILLLQLHNMCMCWAAVEILEQLLQTIFLALGFAFDLSGAPEILQQGAMQSFI